MEPEGKKNMASDPRKQEILVALRTAIEAGKYGVGDKLPTERDLSDRFKASRNTIRAAIELLRAAGWVDTRYAQGHFVRRRMALRRRYSPEHPRGGPVTDLHGEPLEGLRTDVYVVEVIHADPVLAGWLEVDEGSEVTVRRRVWYMDEVPMLFWDSFFPRDLAQGTPLDGRDRLPQGSYQALVDLGMRPVVFTEAVSSREPTDEERRVLRLGEGVQVLEAHRASRDGTGRVVEVLRVRGGTDRNVFTYEDIPIPEDADLT